MTPPEPLQAFDTAATALAGDLRRLDALLERYRAVNAAGGVPANSVEAVRVELTYNSNAIEGSTLSLRDTALIVEGREPNSGKSLREIDEARNLDRALMLVESWVKAGHSWRLSVWDMTAVLRELTARLGTASSHRAAADERKHTPPVSEQFKATFSGLFDSANRFGVHPAVHAAELHFNFVAFPVAAAYSRRVAQTLMNYRLLRAGYPHTVIPVERRAEYLAALDAANARDGLPFAAFILSCVENSTRWMIGEE